MKDEIFTFIEDIKEKKSIGRGAFHKKGNKGTRGCKLPHEYMTRKELNKMNSEVKAINLNKPVKWREFKALDADIQKQYIKRLRDIYNVNNNLLAEWRDFCSRIEELPYSELITEETPNIPEIKIDYDPKPLPEEEEKKDEYINIEYVDGTVQPVKVNPVDIPQIMSKEEAAKLILPPNPPVGRVTIHMMNLILDNVTDWSNVYDIVKHLPLPEGGCSVQIQLLKKKEEDDG